MPVNSTLHAVPAIVDDRVVLWVYQGNRMRLEIPLRRRQAAVLAARLLNLALLPAHDAPSPSDLPGNGI
jgi:hypothetical protein